MHCFSRTASLRQSPRRDRARIASAEGQCRRYLSCSRDFHEQRYCQNGCGRAARLTNDPGRAAPLGSNEGQQAMESNGCRPIDYDTHILIGSTSSRKMVVICHWSHLPRQAEVQQRMESVQEWYATFLLCTPTSIMPVENKGERKRSSSLGRPRRTR